MDVPSQLVSNTFIFDEITDEVTWNNYLSDNRIRNLYNTWTWGEYKSRTGWAVCRLFVKEHSSNQIIGALQLQSKKIGPSKIVLVQGGIHLPFIREDKCLEIFRALHNEYLKLGWRDLIVVNYYESAADIYTRSMLRLGYMPLHNNKMYSFIVDFSTNDGELENKLTKNWRRNLKRAQKNKELSLRWCDSIEERKAAFLELSAMYTMLKERKSFSGAVDTSKIEDLVINDMNFLIVVAEDGGSTAAVRIGYQSSKYMIDFLAASNELAKKNYSNYLLLWTLIKKAEELKLDGFECGGIDPLENIGVYNFKRGLNPCLNLNGPLWCYNKSRTITKFLLGISSLIY